MACQQCGKLTKKPTNKFCSNECKFESFKVKKEPLNPNINIKCKIDGKIFEDYENRSGSLTKYSLEILQNPFDWEDWEQINVDVAATWNCQYCDWKCKCDGTDISGQIANHLENKHSLSREQHVGKYPNDRTLWKHYWVKMNKQNFLFESDENRVQCMECKEWFAKISNTHLFDKHGMTTDQYKLKYPNCKIVSDVVSDKSRDAYNSNDKMKKGQ